MKDEALNEVSKKLNWKEKVILKIFSKTFQKVYNIARINTFNKVIK